MTIEQIQRTAAARDILPTGMDTAGLRGIAADIRARSLFSARTTNARYLAKVANVLDRLLGGEINQSTARAELQEELDAIGYDPETGFPGDEGMPPAERGSLRDHSSDRRINLMLETQELLAYGHGQHTAGLTRVDTWPAWELVRVKDTANPRDWQRRWETIGADLHDGGRMVAHKLDPIWQELGSSAYFDDALDTHVPPFAFNSGMGWRELRADEVAALGIAPDDFSSDSKPQPSMNADLQASINKIPEDIIAALRKQMPVLIEGNKARYQQELDESRKAYLAKLGPIARARALERMQNRIARVIRQSVIKNRLVAWLNKGTSAGAKRGWETRRRNGWTPATKAPARITVQEADALLTAGFSEQDSRGDTVHFGMRLKNHIEVASHTQADIKGRKEHLEWARETVRSGQSREMFHQGELRKIYSKVFVDERKRKGFRTVVSIRDGEAYSIFRIPARKAMVKNHEKYQAEEQPSGYVLQAIAAAGGSEDYHKVSPTTPEVKPC